ncbi:MAG: DnaJ domain-containing protein [Firmicutes bacterium]|nr:DnaJ domain-containing protein [Bacillota bacterium]
MAMRDFYKILGVSPTARDAEIKQAYRQRAKLWHPDINQGDPKAAAKLAEINDANAVLSNAAARAKYDKEFAAYKQSKANPFAGGFAGQPPPFNWQFQGQRPPFSAQFNPQAQQRQQVEQMTASAYNTGYTKGFTDSENKRNESEKTLTSQIIMLNSQVSSLAEKARIAERAAEEANLKVRDFEKNTAKYEDELGALRAQNETLWVRITESQKEAVTPKTSDTADAKNLELQTMIAELNHKIKNLTEQNREFIDLNKELTGKCEDAKKAQQQAEVKVSEQVSEHEKTVNNLTQENQELKEKIEELEIYISSRDESDSHEDLVHEREGKLKQVKKMIKNTHYGTLGVVFWAEANEIEAAYNRLHKRYSIKYEKGDHRAKQKLDELDNAHNVLTNVFKRRSYNTTIDITEEDIRQERREQKEFEAAVEKYMTSKAEDEFWAYLEELMFYAQTGDSESQNLLGEMYYCGDEIDKDLSQAFYWFKEAAKQQHADALYNLGICYLNGEGTKHDEVRGIKYIQQASKLGNKEAAEYVNKMQ